MSKKIPKPIQEEFTIVSDNIKYPTYPDEDYQTSISEDTNLNNYSKENTEKTFNEFLSLFTNCKNTIYDIISKNKHNFNDYCCSNLNEKAINYVFYFYTSEKLVNLIKHKYFKTPLDDNLKKECLCEEMINDCINLNNSFSELYKKEYKDKNENIFPLINPIVEKYNTLLKSDKEIGNIIIRTIMFIHKYIFIPLKEELDKFIKIENFKEEDFFKSNINEEHEIILLNMIYILKKLAFLEFAFYNSAILDINDICNLEESSDEWKNLKKIFFRIIPKNVEEIKQRINERKMTPEFGYSIMSNIQTGDSATSIIYSGVKNFFYYKNNENKAKIDGKKYQITNNFDKIREYAGLFKKFKFMYMKFIPNIEFRRKIYVKKELPHLNKMYIEKLINFMKGENNPVNSDSNSILNNLEQNTINNNIDINSLPIIYRDKVPDKTLKRNYVSVTILHTEKIYFKDEKKQEGFFSSFFKGFQKSDESSINEQIENKFRKNTIMIAIHGGGFIASSTLIHERYLRRWAGNLNIPIFGFNYSLAPEYQYPEALNDVFQAYIWILKHAKEELNMDIKHIILTGDSAGGNIALGLNNLLIVLKEYEPQLKNIILPELFLAHYPVTYTNLKSFSNSYIMSLHDSMLMLNPNAMKYMCEKYVGKYELEDEDPFLNPIKVTEFILERMKARIRIFIGSRDVLREDGIKLLNIFSRYNNREDKKNVIDARGYEILYLGHGFNGYDEKIQQISRNAIMPEIEEFLNKIN